MHNSDSPQLTPAKKTARHQLIPFVAVVFLLLATFAMLTTTMEKKSSLSLENNFGGCSCGAGTRGEPPVVLQVTDAGLFWNKALITQRELPGVLAKYAATCKNPRILLAGDDRAKYGTTVETFDEIRKAGIKQVTIETVYRRTGE